MKVVNDGVWISDFNGASTIKVFNATFNVQSVEVRQKDGTEISILSLKVGTFEIIKKAPTDTVSSFKGVIGTSLD